MEFFFILLRHCIAAVSTCARNNPATKLHGHGICWILLTYLLNLSQHYDADVDVMCNSLFAYFLACCNSPTRACNIVSAFILFHFIADVCMCAINAVVYFIAAFILFYCTWNHSFQWSPSGARWAHRAALIVLFSVYVSQTPTEAVKNYSSAK